MILPKEPGLSRRLSYGNYIRTLHSHRYSNRFLIRGSPIQIEHIEVEPIELSYPIEFDNANNMYDNTNNIYNPYFEDVKMGINLNELLNYSEILLEDSLFFCCICQDQNNFNNNFNNIQIVRKIKCNHAFHINCIEKWLSKNKSCPMCRFYLGID